MEWGGSNIRPESTGYGTVFFGEEVLGERGECYKGKRCFVSGAGNVAQYCAELLVRLGAVVLTVSDSRGFVYKPEGLTADDVQQASSLKRGPS